MMEWSVQFVLADKEECLIVLPSRMKLLVWLLTNIWRCRYLTIFAGDFYDDYE